MAVKTTPYAPNHAEESSRTRSLMKVATLATPNSAEMSIRNRAAGIGKSRSSTTTEPVSCQLVRRAHEHGKLRSVTVAVIVQHVLVEWTKHSRGGDGAARRAAVPDSAPLPADLVVQDGEVAWHGLLAREPDFLLGPAAEPPLGLVRLDEVRGETAVVVIDVVALRPQRPDNLPVRIQVGRGDTARLVWNQRRALESTWAYEQHTFNVGVVPLAPVDPHLFTSGDPIVVRDQRVRLR